MNQINPHQLWISHIGDSRDFQEVFDKGIQAIIQLAVEEQPIQPPRSLVFCRFPLLDGNGNDPGLLYLAISSVAFLVKCRIPTLVCCWAGMSRSPAIVAAALSLVKQANLEDCLKYVTEFHTVDISPGLWEDVCHVLEQDRKNSY
ncbi:MAG TPA: dual specificity protein phosphatase [Thermoguttaceae bacterium]